MFRVLVTIAVLCWGVYGVLGSLAEEHRPQPTHWFSRVVPVGDKARELLAAGHSEYRERQKERVQALRDAHIERERKRLAAQWAPRETLIRIACQYNESLSLARAEQIADAILSSSERHDVDPLLVAALIAQESRFRPSAISPGGAVGLGQLLPGTAGRLGVNPYSPVENVEGCTKYLATQLRKWNHASAPAHLALASYNAGPGAVEQYGGVPPYSITRRYVQKITHRREQFSKQARTDRDRWLSANGPKYSELFEG